MAEYARLVLAVDSTAARRATDDLRKLGAQSDSTESSAQVLSKTFASLRNVLGGIGIGVGIKSLIDMADGYGQMADRIRMATASATEYSQVQARLLQTANSTYRPLQEAQEVYIRTADAIRSLGYTTNDALDITDSFSYLLVTNAASADKAQSAISAYAKAVQTGKVSSEAWESILAAMPSIATTLADGLGSSSDQIRKLGIEGKLGLNDLNEGLRRTVDQSKAAADGMGTTLNDAITRASNNLTAYLGESDKANSASRALSSSLDLLSENIGTAANVTMGLAVAAAAQYAIAQGKSTAATVADFRAKQAKLKLDAETALAEKSAAAVTLERARADLVAAEQKVASDRIRQASELQNLKSIQATIAAENLLEQGRLRAQISETGRAKTVARMAEIRLAETAIIKQVEAAEKSLAATTIATSQAAQAAYAARANAAGIYAERTKAANAAVAASERLTAGLAATGGRLLGVLGGPAGLAITAGLVALSFVDFTRDAKSAETASDALGRSMDNLTSAADRARNRFAGLLGDVSKLNRAELQLRTSELETQLNNAERQLKSFKRQFERGTGSQGMIDGAEAAVTALRQRLAELGVERAALDNEATKDGENYIKRLTEQRALIGAVSEEERVRAMIREGLIKVSPGEEQRLILLAQEVDANQAVAQAEKDRATERQRSAEQIARSYESAASSMEQQIALYGQTTEVARLRYEMESGSLQGLASKHAAYLTDLAKELDAKRDLTEQEQLRITLLRESGQLRAASDAQFELEYAAKILEYEKAGNVEAAQRLETLRRIREIQMNADQAPGTVEGVTQAPRSTVISPEIGGPSSEMMRLEQDAIALDQWRATELEKQRAFLEAKAIDETTYQERERNIFQQHQEQLAQIEASRQQVQLAAGEAFFGNMAGLTKMFAGEQSTAYKAMFALEKSYALAKVLMNAPKTASDAYSAMAGIPYIGPALGVAAAAAALSYQAAQASGISSINLSGMAHDGIDSIPREGTWLLDKGERVVDRRTNADLKDYLSSGGGQGGSYHNENHVTVYGNPDANTLALIEKATEDGAARGYQRVANDLAMGRGAVHKGLQGGYSVGRRRS